MNKYVFKPLVALLLLACCSCDDNDGDYAAYMDFVTVRTLATSSDCYFQLDDGQTLYPGDRSRIGIYDAVDGQRALLYFSLLSETVPGYDYNAAIYEIRDIYTGETRLLTAEELALLPDDKVSLYDAWLRTNYLTLQIVYPVADNSKHNFTLACAEPAQSGEETSDDAEYLEVELRHDASGDTEGENRNCYISFPLEPLRTLLEGRKGISLRIQTQYNGVKSFQIDMR